MKIKKSMVNNKSLYIIFVIFILLFSFIIPCSAASYNVYSSTTENNSQISLLIQALFNQKDFDPFSPWVAFRSGEYDYSLFYNIKSDNSAKRLRYYGTSSGYSTIWHLSITDEYNFQYNTNDYTVVGSQSGTLGSQQYRNFLHQYIIKYTVPFILVLFIFFIFRIKKRGSILSL